MDDLNVKAQQGLLSPDDYIIDEESFTKGHMTYKKASELLPRDCFAMTLSAPEATQPAKSKTQEIETQIENYETGRAQESYKSSSSSQQESVSAFSEWMSNLSFANVATTCVVVLAAFWFFENNNQKVPARQPADVSSEQAASQKKTVEREIVKRDYRAAPEREVKRVEKLMPTERPRSVVSGRPAVKGSAEAPTRQQPQVARDELRREENVVQEQERGIASEGYDERGNPMDQRATEENYDSQLDSGPVDVVQDDYPPPPQGGEDDVYGSDPIVEPEVIDVPEDDYY